MALNGWWWTIASAQCLSLFVATKAGNEIIVASNFTPVPRHEYRFGINQPGRWREELNTDSMHYHGSNTGNGGVVESEAIASHGREHSSITLPRWRRCGWCGRRNDRTHCRKARAFRASYDGKGVNFASFPPMRSGWNSACLTTRAMSGASTCPRAAAISGTAGSPMPGLAYATAIASTGPGTRRRDTASIRPNCCSTLLSSRGGRAA